MARPHDLLMTCAASIFLVACADPNVSLPVPLAPILEQADASDSGGVRAALVATGLQEESASRPFPSPYDPAAIDSIRTLRYEGLAVELYWVGTSGQELVQSISVTGDRFDTGLGLGVGASRELVLEVLGAPGRVERGVWSWDFYQGLDDPIPTALTLRFDDGGRVTEIRWEYYLG